MQDKFHKEIKKISTFQSLMITRFYVLIFSLFVTLFYFSYRYGLYCLYIFFFTLLCQEVLDQVFQGKQFSSSSDILPTFKEAYAYNPKKYVCYHISHWITVFLIAIWLFSVAMHPVKETIINYLPAFLLGSTVLLHLFLSYYFRIKFHMQLKNNQW